MTTIALGTWRHRRDGYEVKVQPGRFFSKDADDAAWQTAVAFTRLDEDNQTHQRTYIRLAHDFANRFEPAEVEEVAEVPPDEGQAQPRKKPSKRKAK